MKLTDRMKQLAQFGVEVKGRNFALTLADPGALIVYGNIIARYDDGAGVEFCVPSSDPMTCQLFPHHPLYKILVAEIGKEEAERRTERVLCREDRLVFAEEHVILDLQTKMRYEFVLPSRDYLGIVEKKE